MWHIATYQPTTFFSLRPYNATTSGGKTLIVPTPFAIKMALLDVAIRVHGLPHGKKWFPHLRDLKVACSLPQRVVVNNSFIKILRPHKSGAKDVYGTGLVGPMGNTIAYREMVQFGGPIQLAVKNVLQKVDDGPPPLRELLAQIHYLGKRGGFMQFMSIAESEELQPNYTVLNPSKRNSFQIEGTLQMLDDCGPKMTFEHVNVYSGKRISVNRYQSGRFINTVVLPYQPVRSSRSFTLYHRIQP